MTVLQGIQPLGAPAEITRALRFRFPRSTRLASRGAIILFAATLPFCGGAFAQSVVPTVPALLQQVGSKLVGGGATNPANQGSAVALSTDGNTAIVGGQADNGGIGGAWIFTRTNGVWSQQGGELIGSNATGAAAQGFSVAISADGLTVAFGGDNDNSGLGAVWVFTWNDGLWAQQGAKLVGSQAVGAAAQGFSVALSADGNALALGGPQDNSGVGALWTFTRSSAVWTQQGSKLIATGATDPGGQGTAVALSSDGGTLIEGAATDDSSTGAFYFFTRSGSTWSQQGEKMVPSDSADGVDLVGSSVAISGDGNTAVVGGPADNDVGGFWIYQRTAGSWTQFGGKLVGSADANDSQGSSVAISRDGGVVLESDPSNVGGVWMFAFTTSLGNWYQLGGEITGSGAVGNSSQGNSVALSGDGNTALVGGENDNSLAGATWAFDTGINYWSANVGATVTHTISFTFPYEAFYGGATLQTQGAPSLDFALAFSQPQAGACTLGTDYQQGATCLITVQFTPSAPGLRFGGLVIATVTEGPPYAIVNLEGFGLGPQVGFISGIINTAAGTGGSGYTGDGGAATSAELGGPIGVGVDGLGNFYVSDCNYGVVREVTVSTGLISTFAGNGSSGPTSGDGGPATSAQMRCPIDVKVDGAGNVYIADPQNSVVRVVNAATGDIYTVAGSGLSGYSGDGGPAVNANIGSPAAIALDPAGNLYIADANLCNIRKVSAISGLISTVAGGGGCGYSGDGGQGDAAELGHALALALDSAGDLYISDDSNYVIRLLNTTTGIISTFAGTGSAGYSGDGGLAASAALNDAEGLALDAVGNLYFTDSGNNLVRKITVGTGVVNRFAGDGTTSAGYTGDGGAATSALLNYPSYPAIDSAGNFYEVEEGNFVVRKINGAAALAFGTVAVSSTSSPQDITISNNGTAPLSLSTLAVSGPFSLGGADTTCASQSIAGRQNNGRKLYDRRGRRSGSPQPADFALEAGGSCIASVVFMPTAPGAASGSLTLGSNTIPLSGTGSGGSLTSTATALTISPNPANAGQTITFTATVSPIPTGSPTGTVSFYSEETLLGSATVNGSGIATFTSNSLTAGTTNITAVYSGNTDFATSTSSALSLTVQSIYTIMAPQTPFTAEPGGTVVVQVTVPPVGGSYDSLVTLSASGLPAGAVATFDPPAVTPGASGAPTTMTIQLAAASASIPANRDRRLPVAPIGIVAAALFFAGQRKRIGKSLAMLLLTLSVIGGALTMAGCNGGFVGKTAQSQTYVITITGTSGNLHPSTTITLIVQ